MSKAPSYEFRKAVRKQKGRGFPIVWNTVIDPHSKDGCLRYRVGVRDALDNLRCARNGRKRWPELYRAARAEAMRPVRLPTDHYADPLFRQAMADARAAVKNMQPLMHVFDWIFGKAA